MPARARNTRESDVDALRDMIFAAETFRAAVADHFGVGIRETQAAAHLHAGDGLSAGELSRRLDLTPGTVTNLINRLERAGLAGREAHPSDQRRVTVRLTPRGHALVTTVRGWLARILDELPDRDAAHSTIETIARRLRETRDELRAGDGAAVLDAAVLGVAGEQVPGD